MEIFELRERVEEIRDLSEAERLVTELKSGISEIERNLQKSFEQNDLQRFGDEAVRLKYVTKVAVAMYAQADFLQLKYVQVLEEAQLRRDDLREEHFDAVHM